MLTAIQVVHEAIVRKTALNEWSYLPHRHRFFRVTSDERHRAHKSLNIFILKIKIRIWFPQYWIWMNDYELGEGAIKQSRNILWKYGFFTTIIWKYLLQYLKDGYIKNPFTIFSSSAKMRGQNFTSAKIGKKSSIILTLTST